jgi:HD superfamily phosphodiesterase
MMHMNESELEFLFQKSLPVVQAHIQAQNRFSPEFRNRVQHTLRVLNWANRIQPNEGGDFAVIRLAVLFHDTGWSETINHAVVSASLAEDFLLENGVEITLVQRIVSAVKTHNLREIPAQDLPLENRIVMDADLLDEVGVTALVWDAMAAAGESEPGYLKVLAKDIAFYLNARKRKIELKTVTGLVLYQERLDLWFKLLEHLAFELGVENEELLPP